MLSASSREKTSLTCSNSLEHPEAPELPICMLEGSGIGRNEFAAHPGATSLPAIVGFLACPLPAQIDIDDDTVVPEMVSYRASSAREICKRQPPS